MENLSFLPIKELSHKLSMQEISAQALTQNYLGRIKKLNPLLNAYIDVYEDLALTQAIHSDQRRAKGYTLGPLDGIPIAVKDLCDIEGRITTAGSKVWKDRVGVRTAPAIARLLEAGAVILGKTHMVEFAFGSWGTNPLLGTPKNPWDMAVHRIPGGSSSGSGVAVAAGLAAAAIGSDTGGSVRIPAGLNGITGLKTTAGLISLSGVAALSYTLDSLGPMTRSTWDAALLTQIMAGYKPTDSRTHNAPRIAINLNAQLEIKPLLGTVIGLISPSAYPITVASAVTKTLNNTIKILAKLGATIIERPLPFDFHEMMILSDQIIAAEAYTIHQGYIDNMDLEIGPWARQRVQGGKAILAASYIDAMKRHKQAISEWTTWMADTDALLVPNSPIAACSVSEVDETKMPLTAFTKAGNFTGSCCLALPTGFDENRLPIGVQLFGKPYNEDTLIKIGNAFQHATTWHLQHPVL